MKNMEESEERVCVRELKMSCPEEGLHRQV